MNTRSHTEIYLHLAWATKLREPLLSGEVERVVHAAIRQACLRERCAPLAVDGVDDHVHTICRTKGMVAPSRLAERLKSLSSGQVTAQLGIAFAWQEGFGGFSVSPRLVPQAIQYVEQQKIHHLQGTTLARYEIFSDKDAERLGREPLILPGQRKKRR